MEIVRDRVTVPDLLRFLYRETAGARLWIVIPSVISGFARGGLLAVFNEAAARAAAQGFNSRLFAVFAGCLLAFLATSYISSIACDRMMRMLLHRLRLSISTKLADAPLRLIERQDPGKIFTLIGHESESLATVARDFIQCFQAFIVLAFALAYLAWLSPLSFLLAIAVIAAGGTVYYWSEEKAKQRYQLARAKEVEYFDTMYDLLHGFRELKLGRAQQGEILAHMHRASDEFRSLAHGSARIYHASAQVSQTFTFLMIAIIVFANYG